MSLFAFRRRTIICSIIMILILLLAMVRATAANDDEESKLLQETLSIKVTREDAVTLLMQHIREVTDMEGANLEGSHFTDADSLYIEEAYCLGITHGVGYNKFDPLRLITPQEYLVMLYRTLEYCTALPLNTEETFDLDDSPLEDWAILPVQSLIKNGLFEKKEIDTLLITSDMSIEQVLGLLTRVDIYLEEQNCKSHVPLYEDIDFYTTNDFIQGMQCSKIETDFLRSYHLFDTNIGISILVNPTETYAIVLFNNQISCVPIEGLFSSIDPVTISLQDLTCDGIPELCYFKHYNGTGVNATDSLIFDIKSMNVIDTENIMQRAANDVNVVVESMTNGVAVCKIKDSNGLNLQHKNISINLSEAHPNEIHTIFDNLRMHIENNVLIAEVDFSLENSMPGEYLGYIKYELNYSTISKMFEIHSLGTIHLYDEFN